MVTSENFEESVLVAEAMSASGRAQEDVLGYLREVGLSIIESMRVIIRVHGYSLAEAKQIVHTSDVWADERVANEEFHEYIIRALDAEEAVEEKRENS